MVVKNNIIVNNKEKIDEIKKYHSSSNLDEIIKITFPNQSTSFYFQIKSEIKRLGKKCNRILDLRDKIKNTEIQDIEYQGVRHHLTEKTLIEFRKLIEYYNGEYTLDVFESINQYVKNLKQQEFDEFNKKTEKKDQKEKKLKTSLSNISFTDFFIRKEERMHFAVPISIFEEEGVNLADSIRLIKHSFANGERKSIQNGLTTDISINGLGIKVSNLVEYQKGQKLVIRMTGIEGDFVVDQPFIQYEVIKIEDKNQFKYIALKKIEDDLNSEINTYTKNLINGNKKRYKISLENVVEAVKGKSYEQFYISKLTNMPVYFNLNQDTKELTTKYNFINKNSSNIINFFKHPQQNNIFEQAIKHSKLSNLIDADKEKCILYFACFYIEKNDKKHFYSFSAISNDDINLKKFIKYGSQINTLKVFKINFMNINGVEDSFIPSTLPKDILKQVSPQEMRISPLIERSLSDINYLGIFTDVTRYYNMDFFKHIKIEKIDLTFLSQCQVKNFSEAPSQSIQAESNEFTNHDRFMVNTMITIHKGVEKIICHTTDISVEGFRVKFDSPNSLSENINVKVSFNEYEQNYHNLNNLNYKIVNHNDNTLYLQAIGDLQVHKGAIFWKKYINSNYNKLRHAETNNNFIGLSKALRNIFSKHHNNLLCFLETSNRQVKPFAISYSHNLGSRCNLLNKLNINQNNLHKEIQPLLFNHNFLNRVDLISKSITADAPIGKLLCFVSFKNFTTEKKIFKVMFEDQFKTERDKYDFLNTVDKSESFVFELEITKKTRVFNKYFKNEINYIQSYSLYKAEKLMENISRVSGLVEIKDITNIIKSQYK